MQSRGNYSDRCWRSRTVRTSSHGWNDGVKRPLSACDHIRVTCLKAEVGASILQGEIAPSRDEASAKAFVIGVHHAHCVASCQCV
jgi:hypothetical protein